MDRPGPIVLFDGVCNLCAASVQFLIARDPEARLRFAPLQSEAARRLVGDRVLDLDTILLVEGGQVYGRSTAAIRIARHLSGAWPLAGALLAVPAGVRDAVYDVVARHRYAWFGRQTACWLPTPALRARFLDTAGPGVPESAAAPAASGPGAAGRSGSPPTRGR